MNAQYVLEIKEEYRDGRAQFLRSGESGYTSYIENAGKYTYDHAWFLQRSDYKVRMRRIERRYVERMSLYNEPYTDGIWVLVPEE